VSSPSRLGAIEKRRRRIISVVFAIAIAASLFSGFDPLSLFDKDGASNFGELASGFLSPDLSASFLSRVATLAWESLLIGVLGTALATVFAIALAFLAARPHELADAPGKRRSRQLLSETLRLAARLILAIARSVPEIVWAFLFVRIFGLGPGAAVFAIALTFGGIIGKLYAELAESVDPDAPRALRAAGASRLGVFLYGVVPQVRRQWLGYALFRLECAIRSASVLGVVGAGGLGAEIDLSVRYFQYDKLATTLLAILAFISVLEVASWFLRRAPARITLGLFAIGSFVAATSLAIPWSALVSGDSLDQVRIFFSDLTSPTTSLEFLSNTLRLVLETIAMAAIATIAASVVALALAPLATRFSRNGSLSEPPGRSGLSRFAFVAASVVTRILFQVSRAVPDLVWALLFVVWVGPGVTAGVLALSVHTTGVLGRLFGDVFEEAEPGPSRALEASGASVLGQYLYGLLPQCMARLAAFALFRFEVNVRAAAMIGFVGAGGLGDALHTAISLFHSSDLATLMLTMFAAVTFLDIAGDRIRARLAR